VALKRWDDTDIAEGILDPPTAGVRPQRTEAAGARCGERRLGRCVTTYPRRAVNVGPGGSSFSTRRAKMRATRPLRPRISPCVASARAGTPRHPGSFDALGAASASLG